MIPLAGSLRDWQLGSRVGGGRRGCPEERLTFAKWRQGGDQGEALTPFCTMLPSVLWHRCGKSQDAGPPQNSQQEHLCASK